MQLAMNHSETLEDAELIARCRSGDRTAFDTLVQRYQRVVHAIAFSVLRDQEASLDVLQESFISAYKQLPSLEDPSRFGNWICAIARTQARRLYGDRKRLHTRELPLPEGEALPSGASDADIKAERILDALSALTRMQADIVTMFYMEGYSVRECASLLGIPEGTVKRRLHDARQRLKEEMTDMVQQLNEFALPADYRVAIDRPSQVHTTAPSLAWFMDRWVLVWQDGEPWEPYDGPFWFWLSESADGKAWSEPRRLSIEPQWQSLPKLCVLGDELILHTHHHHGGLRVHRSVDLVEWSESPLIHAYDVGRSGVFCSGGDLYIAYPLWRANEAGDVVEVIRSRDGGVSWTWLDTPFAGRVGITDAAGQVIDGRIVIAWRGHDYPSGVGNPNKVWTCWSEDDGKAWTDPVLIEPLTTQQGSFELEILGTPDGRLAVIQDVRRDLEAGSGEVWIAISPDGGQTWPQKAVYSEDRLTDPAAVLAHDGSLVLVGSYRIGKESKAWVVHSRIVG